MSDGIDPTDIVINPGEVKVIGSLNVTGAITTDAVVTANDFGVVGGLLSLKLLWNLFNGEEKTRQSNEAILQNSINDLESHASSEERTRQYNEGMLQNRISDLESTASNLGKGVAPILNVVPMISFPGTIPGVPTPGVPLYQSQEGLRISPNEIEYGMFKFDESGNVANFTPKTAFLKSLQQLQQDVAAIKTHLRL